VPSGPPGAGPDGRFGADLYAALRGRGNLVFSPAAVAAALRMVLLGARGDTAAQLAAVLHLAGPQDAADGLRAVAGLPSQLAPGGITLRAPNTLWLQAGLPVQPDFTAALAGAGSVTLRQADFVRAAGPARREINRLIAEQTAGRITGLLAPGVLGGRTRLVLASAVYLKAAWAHPFPPGGTHDGPFHPAPGRLVTVAMMRVRARLRYARGEGYQVVELPYAGQRLAMMIVALDGPPRVLAAPLAAGGLAGLLTGLAPRQVMLTLPRFRVTSQVALRPVLTGLGMPLPFAATADFTGISTAGGLAISEVVHQADIDVTEPGTEAAAATAVVAVAAARARRGDPPVEVTVDRPFLFAIVDAPSGLPLFLGQVTDPARAGRGDGRAARLGT
jgi:serpin B